MIVKTEKGICVMDSYELLKTHFTSAISDFVSSELLDKILFCLDMTAENYTISKRECALTVSENDYPEAVKAYLVSKAVEEKSKATLSLYKYILCKFFSETRKDVTSITANDIRIWIHKYKQFRKVSASTLDTARRCLNAFFEWCNAEGIIPLNPMKKKIYPIKAEKKERKPMSPLELEYIRKACKTLREKAVVDFMYSTACRVSEVCNAKIKNINWTNHTILIEEGKGGITRTTYINPECEVSLRAYLQSRNDSSEYLFVSTYTPKDKPLHVRVIQKMIKNLTSRIQGQISVPVTPHVFRHTSATIVLKNGMPIAQVQCFLGHANINTTMIYAAVDIEDVRLSHQKYVS